MSKLLLLKRYNFKSLEQSLTADSTTPAIFGVEFTAMPAAAAGSSVNNATNRTACAIVLKGVHIQLLLNNNQSATMYVRVVVGWTRANVTMANVLAGTSVLEEKRDGGGEYFSDVNMHPADAQAAVHMFTKPSQEIFGKIVMDRQFRVGPSGGAGAFAETRTVRRFLKFNRRINYEDVTVTTGTASTAKGWKLVMLVAAYDGTMDATTPKTVEITNNSICYWYDCLDS